MQGRIVIWAAILIVVVVAVLWYMGVFGGGTPATPPADAPAADAAPADAAPADAAPAAGGGN